MSDKLFMYKIKYTIGNNLDTTWTAGVLATSSKDAVDFLQGWNKNVVIRSIDGVGDIHVVTDLALNKMASALKSMEPTKTNEPAKTTEPEIKKKVLKPKTEKKVAKSKKTPSKKK